MKDVLQQISARKPYRVKFGCKENKCDYSQLFINLIKNSNFDDNKYIIKDSTYNEVINSFKQVYDLYDSEAYKSALKRDNDIIVIDLKQIRNSKITTKIALYFLFYNQQTILGNIELLFLLQFLNLDICQSLLDIEDYKNLANGLLTFCLLYIKKNEIWNIIKQENLIDYVHSIYEKEITNKAILKYDLSTEKSIYTSVFRIDDFNSFLIDDEKFDGIYACIRFIVSSYIFIDNHEKIIIGLLDFAKENNFVLFYILLEHIRNLNPRILTDLLDDPDYGAISINLLYDYLINILTSKRELRIEETVLIEIFTANVEKFTQNLSRLTPEKRKFDTEKDIAFVLCSALEFHNKNYANKLSSSFQKTAIEVIQQNIITAFNVNNTFQKNKLVYMADSLLPAPEQYFSNISKLGYTLFFFNYFSQLHIEATVLDCYSESINKLFDSVLHQKHFFNDTFDTVDFTNYLMNYDCDKTFLHGALQATNENSTLFYHYRNICLLKIIYQFYLKKPESFKNNNYFEFTINLIQNCFLPEPKEYTRTLDSIFDKNGKYKENAIEILDFICSASKKYEFAYKNLVNELPYKMKFFVFNISKNKEIQFLLAEYLSDVQIDEVNSDVNYLPDLIKFTIDVYNSHLNKTLAKGLLDKLHKFIISRFSEKKEYQILLKELEIFDAYINSDEAKLDSYNKYDYENELRMYYKSILLFKKGKYEIPHKYMSALVKQHSDKIDYKILLMQIKQAMGEEFVLQDYDELLKTVQEGEDD